MILKKLKERFNFVIEKTIKKDIEKINELIPSIKKSKKDYKIDKKTNQLLMLCVADLFNKDFILFIENHLEKISYKKNTEKKWELFSYLLLCLLIDEFQVLLRGKIIILQDENYLKTINTNLDNLQKNLIMYRKYMLNTSLKNIEEIKSSFLNHEKLLETFKSENKKAYKYNKLNFGDLEKKMSQKTQKLLDYKKIYNTQIKYYLAHSNSKVLNTFRNKGLKNNKISLNLQELNQTILIQAYGAQIMKILVDESFFKVIKRKNRSAKAKRKKIRLIMNTIYADKKIAHHKNKSYFYQIIKEKYFALHDLEK